MTLAAILAELDSEIANLKQARSLLNGGSGRAPERPKGATTVDKPARKHNISPEGHKRIAEAVKRRWAVHKKTSGK